MVKVKEYIGCASRTIKVLASTRLGLGSPSRSRAAHITKQISCLATAWCFAKTSCLLVFLISSVALPVGDDSSKQRAQTTSSTPQSREHLKDANTLETQTVDESSQGSSYVATKTKSEIAQQLYQYIGPPENKKSEENKRELRRLIEQVRSIRFEQKGQKPKAAITVEPVAINVSDSNQTSLVSVDSSGGSVKAEGLDDGYSASENQSRAATLPYRAVSAQTLQMLENPEQFAADQLNNPMQLAEILFLSGHLKQAAVFYHQALNRIDPNDVMSAQDRAWILFQIGNCLWEDQGDQPGGLARVKPAFGGVGQSPAPDQTSLRWAAAKKMYRQLIEEYPNCPWANLARSREILIDWFLDNEPEKLIEESKF